MREPLVVPSLLIDAGELARLLSISKPSLWRWLENGRLPEPIRFTAQSLRWRRDVVIPWIESGCPAANNTQATEGQA